MDIDPRMQLWYNLDHHGGVVNSGIVVAFIRLAEEAGFEVLQRRVTLTLRRNGTTLVLRRERPVSEGKMYFSRWGDPAPVNGSFVDLVKLRKMNQGADRRMRANRVHQALNRLVHALLNATPPKKKAAA